LAAELKEAFGAKSTLVASGGGVFEVAVDDRPIFSKRSLGRFPHDGEILDLIRAD